MSVTLADLVSRLQADVPARNGVPSPAQYEQAVEDAVEGYGLRRPMQKTSDVAVVSGTASYGLPADFVTIFLRKQKRFLFFLGGFMQTEGVCNPVLGVN
jgi:hypothetical protein